eukprot:UN0372
MANNTFQADFNLNIAWKGEERGKEEDKPVVQIYNLCESADDAEESEVKKGGAGFDWYYRLRVKGTLRQHYDLHAFPFDQQNLCVRVRMKSECTLVPLPWGPTGDAFSVDQDAFEDDFELKSAKVEHMYMPSFKFGKLGGYDPEAVIVFSVIRNYEYWVYNYGCLMSLVCTFSFAVFALPVSDLGDRLGIGFTLNLTVVATFYLMQDKLPPVSYYTELERHMVVCIGFTMAVMVINLSEALVSVGLMERLEWLIIAALVFFWTGYHVHIQAHAEALANDPTAAAVGISETFSRTLSFFRRANDMLVKVYKMVLDKRARMKKEKA